MVSVKKFYWIGHSSGLYWFFLENPVFYTVKFLKKLYEGRICETKVVPYVPARLLLHFFCIMGKS